MFQDAGRTVPAGKGVDQIPDLSLPDRLPRGRELAVAWTAGGKTVLRVTGRGIEAFDIMGNPLDDPRLVVLSDAPVYVTGRGLWVPKKRASR